MIQASGASSLPSAGRWATAQVLLAVMAGMYAVTAILASLYQREKNHEGQRINIPLYDTQVAWLANQSMNYLIGGEIPVREGTGHPNIVPYQTFSTNDGEIMLAIGNDGQFKRLMTVLNETNTKFITSKI